MAVNFYLKLEGITGESQDDVHNGEIEVMSWSFNETQSATAHEGTGSAGGRVSVGDMHFVKKADLSTVPLMQYCTTGKHIPTAMLSCYKAAGDGNRVKYLHYDLEKVYISSIQQGGSDGTEVPTESFSLNFATFKTTYKQQNPDGTEGAAPEFGWNIPANTTL
jgi:type VI secretion system secreted protein Hcp